MTEMIFTVSRSTACRSGTPAAPQTPMVTLYGECFDPGLQQLQKIQVFNGARRTHGTIDDWSTAVIDATAAEYQALYDCLEDLCQFGGSVKLTISDKRTGARDVFPLIVRRICCEHVPPALAMAQLSAIAAATLRETRALHGTALEILSVLRHGRHAQHESELDKLRLLLARAGAFREEPTPELSSERPSPPLHEHAPNGA